MKKVGLTISQIFIALDFTSALTLFLNNFPEEKKTKTKIQVLNKQLVGAQILSEILISDDTAVLLNRTKRSPIRSVIIGVIDKFGRLRSGSRIC